MTRTRTLIAILAALLALPPSAAAQRGGAAVDPESPAGTEYAIPLEEARRHGAGGDPEADGRAGGGARGAPLFGEGIEPAPSGPGRGGGSAGGGDGESGSTGGGLAPNADGLAPNGDGEAGHAAGKGRERRASETDETARDRSDAVAEAAAGGDSDTLVTAGIAAGVLAVGLLVGFSLRRLLRTD
jgi:hypothetical protein